MKKFIILCVVTLGIFNANSFAGNADLFKIDDQVISEKFKGLDQLESYVNQNEGVVLADVQKQNASLVQNFDATNAIHLFNGGGGPPLGIPSFLWGCLLGWVGILVVYMVASDKDETMKALWGCLANGAVSIIFYIIYVALVLSTAASQ